MYPLPSTNVFLWLPQSFKKREGNQNQMFKCYLFTTEIYTKYTETNKQTNKQKGFKFNFLVDSFLVAEESDVFGVLLDLRDLGIEDKTELCRLDRLCGHLTDDI